MCYASLSETQFINNGQTSLYGDGEEHIGKWFKRTGKRDQIFIASKYGIIKGSKTFEANSSYEYTKQACDKSLKALDVDQIDLCKFYLSSSLYLPHMVVSTLEYFLKSTLRLYNP